MHVKHRLVAWRQRQSFTQRDAAKLAGMSQAAWQSYEDDTSPACPGVNAALAIERVTEGEIAVRDWAEADAVKAARRARAISKRVPRPARAS